VNARSELVTSTNCAEGGVLDTKRRFQAASSASIFPARRPTRGSGLGALADLLSVGDGLSEPADEVERAHAAAENNPKASDSDQSGADAITVSLVIRGTEFRS
jgi:hypothetical protein